MAGLRPQCGIVGLRRDGGMVGPRPVAGRYGRIRVPRRRSISVIVGGVGQVGLTPDRAAHPCFGDMWVRVRVFVNLSRVASQARVSASKDVTLVSRA